MKTGVVQGKILFGVMALQSILQISFVCTIAFQFDTMGFEQPFGVGIDHHFISITGVVEDTVGSLFAYPFLCQQPATRDLFLEAFEGAEL